MQPCGLSPALFQSKARVQEAIPLKAIFLVMLNKMKSLGLASVSRDIERIMSDIERAERGIHRNAEYCSDIVDSMMRPASSCSQAMESAERRSQSQFYILNAELSLHSRYRQRCIRCAYQQMFKKKRGLRKLEQCIFFLECDSRCMESIEAYEAHEKSMRVAKIILVESLKLNIDLRETHTCFFKTRHLG